MKSFRKIYQNDILLHEVILPKISNPYIIAVNYSAKFIKSIYYCKNLTVTFIKAIYYCKNLTVTFIKAIYYCM